MLRALAGIHFIGNVEGRDLFNGNTDVAVCDGFVGNVAIKTCEGTAKLSACFSARRSSPRLPRRLAAALPPRLQRLQEAPRLLRVRGAPMLGVRGVCIVGHGSSNEKAVMNASASLPNSLSRSQRQHRVRSAQPLIGQFVRVWFARICLQPLGAPREAHYASRSDAARRGRPSAGQSLNRLFTAQAP